MRRFRTPLVALAAAFLTVGAGGARADAAVGQVIVFGTEGEPVTVYEDPGGCHKLPLTAHVLVNDTSGDVQIHGDPFCVSPGLTVQPGYGAHVAPGSGSFSAV
ncbi:hypothetical protein [Streptomyces minutiscleroticus]|uniref:Secreted protein n=1 Tax=Streptomyces minutiscleroticus TaxID=68238 RepID=A0A918NU99_9ACTN|nr:hypothetical protein [Streptomyces minutiscleroticus]GGX96456.1 hypothetical protein GCM10010358_57830 [Streptomyces minutiscleroticus]